MNRRMVRELVNMLGLEQVTDRDAWVSSTCPFGPWKHDDGVSHRNSFGISVGPDSVYHCFSCGLTGNVTKLPSVLFIMSGTDDKKLREFVYEHEKVTTYKSAFDDRLTPETPDIILRKTYRQRFVKMDFGYRGISEKTAANREMMYDRDDKRIVIPIKDRHNRIVGAKGRALVMCTNPKYLLYTDLGKRDPKTYGIWYGMDLPFTKGKALVLVEGEVDAILLAQSGMVHNVWAVMGTGISREQMKVLAGVQEPLVFFFDDDEAGRELKRKISRKLHGLTPHYEVTKYYSCKDPGEAFQRNRILHLIYSVDKKK